MSNRECNQSTQRAIEGDRHDSLEMWRAVAEGKFSEEIKLWLQHVAEKMLEADAEFDPRRRPDFIMRAAGLASSQDRNRKMRDEAKILKDIGRTNSQIIDELEQRGLVDPESIDARSILDRELRKKK